VSAVKESVPAIGENPGIESLLKSDLGAPLPLHISLSRPITLLTDQRQDFVTAFQSSVKKSGIRP
jgi:hypothetical protein